MQAKYNDGSKSLPKKAIEMSTDFKSAYIELLRHS